ISAASGIEPNQLLRWPPPKELGEPVSHHTGRSHRARPPHEATVHGWQSALLEIAANAHALNYLRGRRGLTDETIRGYELGYSLDRNSISIPVRNAEGKLHSVKFRSLNPLATRGKRNLPRPAALYPWSVFVDDPEFVVLCEGEFDALLLNQH